MTKLLEKVVEEVSKLPEKEQDSWAQIWLEELKDEQQWEEQFPVALDDFDTMATAALAEDKAGLTRPLEELIELPVENQRRVS